MSYWKRVFVNSLGFFILASILPGFTVSNIWIAVIASVVLSFFNILVKPILHILAFPITFLTLGLFSFVINAILLQLTASVVSGFSFDSFGTQLIVAVLLSVFQRVIYKTTEE